MGQESKMKNMQIKLSSLLPFLFLAACSTAPVRPAVSVASVRSGVESVRKTSMEAEASGKKAASHIDRAILLNEDIIALVDKLEPKK